MTELSTLEDFTLAERREQVKEFNRRQEDLARADALDLANRQAQEATREFNSPEQRSARALEQIAGTLSAMLELWIDAPAPARAHPHRDREPVQ